MLDVHVLVLCCKWTKLYFRCVCVVLCCRWTKLYFRCVCCGAVL